MIPIDVGPSLVGVRFHPSDQELMILAGRTIRFIKLNGKLIPLSASGANRYASGDLVVATRDLDTTGNAGLRGQEIIVVPPGAKDELGYHGFVGCPRTA